jgi:hypothetical protein
MTSRSASRYFAIGSISSSDSGGSALARWHRSCSHGCSPQCRRTAPIPNRNDSPLPSSVARPSHGQRRSPPFKCGRACWRPAVGGRRWSPPGGWSVFGTQRSSPRLAHRAMHVPERGASRAQSRSRPARSLAPGHEVGHRSPGDPSPSSAAGPSQADSALSARPGWTGPIHADYCVKPGRRVVGRFGLAGRLGNACSRGGGWRRRERLRRGRRTVKAVGAAAGAHWAPERFRGA